MRVAFLGPAGTFTEEALRASAPREVSRVACATVFETVMAVEHGDAEAAVVPIENSLEGSVTATLDTLATDATRVRIVAEVVHRVRHCLIAQGAVELDDVSRVVSHPQALAQCARFLRERLPAAARASATSTAEAVRIVLASAEPWAAVGSALAAELYGGGVLADGIEDRSGNLTRFVWLAGPEPRGLGIAAAEGGRHKTSIVFWGFNDSSPGALMDVLREFADRDINLTKIESRPRRDELGRYMFFADLDGNEKDRPVSEALSALARRVETLRTLGSYPAAHAVSGRG